ncbi:MAG: hypothetical protein ACJ764_14065, partial [Solirubrobacteraceae bacterium]
MSKLEDYDPDVLATLDAIDATLAGEAVDPQYAEMAELALLLADERPVMDAAFATLLDEGVERRFTAAPRREKRMRARWWAWAPAGALVASLAIAVVIVVGEGGNSGTVQLDNGVRAGAAVGTPSAPVRKTAVVVPHHKETLTPLQTATTSGQVMHRPAARALNTYSAAAQSAPAPVNGTSQTLQLPSTGRKVVQGAQLSLSTSPRRVDQVAQEVFDVVGQQKGFVNNSRVTASGGPGGNAQFQLSVPSSNLAQTMAAL